MLLDDPVFFGFVFLAFAVYVTVMWFLYRRTGGINDTKRVGVNGQKPKGVFCPKCGSKLGLVSAKPLSLGCVNPKCELSHLRSRNGEKKVRSDG